MSKDSFSSQLLDERYLDPEFNLETMLHYPKGSLGPGVIHRQNWETTLRGQVRKLASGWSVVEFRGRLRLKDLPAGQPEQSLILPFRLDSDSTGDAYVRIRNRYTLVAEGHRAVLGAEDGAWPKRQADHLGALPPASAGRCG